MCEPRLVLTTAMGRLQSVCLSRLVCRPSQRRALTSGADAQTEPAAVSPLSLWACWLSYLLSKASQGQCSSKVPSAMHVQQELFHAVPKGAGKNLFVEKIPVLKAFGLEKKFTYTKVDSGVK